MWENSVQPCTTEVWLNHVLWWKQKPSGNYKRSGISLLPGTCKFSFSFKLGAVWRTKEGPPSMAAAAARSGQLLSPTQLLGAGSHTLPFSSASPNHEWPQLRKYTEHHHRKGARRLRSWYYPLSGLHLWHTLMGSFSPQNWEIMKPRKIYIQHFQRRLNALWNIQEQFKCKYGTVLYYSYSATFCFSGLIGRRSFPVCFLLV